MSAARPLHPTQRTNVEVGRKVCVGLEADVHADGTLRLLDYQELTSSIVDADVRVAEQLTYSRDVDLHGTIYADSGGGFGAGDHGVQVGPGRCRHDRYFHRDAGVSRLSIVPQSPPIRAMLKSSKTRPTP